MNITLYSEDRNDSKNGLRSLKKITNKIILKINPESKTNHVNMLPLDESEGVNGSVWKCTNSAELGDQKRRKELINHIATELKLNKYVVFHVDGDTVWSQKNSAEVFEKKELFLRAVKDALTTSYKPKVKTPLSGNEADDTIKNLFFLIPFYSIESWAYANKDKLIEFLPPRGNMSFDEKLVVDSPIQELDEISQIKDKTSIKDSANYELFNDSGWPRDELYNVQKSFYAVIEEMKQNSNLLADLQKTADQPF